MCLSPPTKKIKTMAHPSFCSSYRKGAGRGLACWDEIKIGEYLNKIIYNLLPMGIQQQNCPSNTGPLITGIVFIFLHAK